MGIPPRSGLVSSTESELARNAEFAALFRRVPLADEDLMRNLGMFVRRQVWARYLYLHELFRRALDVHGVVMEFGLHWGQDLALFSAFRGIYEPHNFTRTLIGFDTFSGFPSVGEVDGGRASEGDFAVPDGWDESLAQILAYHESQSPLAHIRKFELVKGDVSRTLPEYLERHPDTIVALAYFDLDLYQPTRDALVALRPHLTRGTVIGFDELACVDWPGETVAVREALGLDSLRLQRLPFSPTTSFAIWEP